MQEKQPNITCANCGSSFHCAVQAGENQCWCFSLPHVLPLTDDTAGCLCPNCLRDAIQKSLAQKSKKPFEK